MIVSREENVARELEKAARKYFENRKRERLLRMVMG